MIDIERNMLTILQKKRGSKEAVSCKYKVKESLNRPGVAQRVPRDVGSKISMTFGT
jgi:hypothetical protein